MLQSQYSAAATCQTSRDKCVWSFSFYQVRLESVYTAILLGSSMHQRSAVLFGSGVGIESIYTSCHDKLKPERLASIGQNVEWPRGRLSLARKKPRREFMTLALARVIKMHWSRHFTGVKCI